MSRIRLSVCIPTFNRGRFIGATLESIISQATPDVEIVVVDGGSTDDTAAVIDRFQARFPGLRYFRSSEPGQAPSLGGFDRDCNRAVELAAGDYCWLFTDDDLLRPGALSTVLDHLARGYSLLVANAEVRNLDLSQVLEDNRLGLDRDRVYGRGEDERLFAETGRYLSFVGAVVVRRDLWLDRDRARHSGLGFVHVGVLFQQPLPDGALAIARPLITIRYGNASWSARSFPIWMLDWPGVVWSFPGISDSAKAQVCLREPATSPMSLLNARAIGTYSLQAYRTWLAPRLPPGPRRWVARLIALLPGRLVNPLGLLYYGMFVDRPGIALANLRASPHFVGERIARLLPHAPPRLEAMMERRRALITGISGQDGVYLAEHLHAQGREVFGVCRGAPPSRVVAIARVQNLDIRDEVAVAEMIRALAPHECYHLAAYHRSSQAVVGAIDPDADEVLHLQTNLLATHALLRAFRKHQPRCRVFLAGSCQMFGTPAQVPQNEDTPLAPESLYGITKVAAARLGRLYGDRHGLFCCTGILYNHESPLRGPSFVTARIAREVVEIRAGRRSELVVGDLEAQVDWGFAGDYVQAMRLMLEAETPADHIVATGRLSTVRDFTSLAFARVGLDWKDHVRQDAKVHAPSRAIYQGDPSRIHAHLGWQATTTLPQLVALMVNHHLAASGPV